MEELRGKGERSLVGRICADRTIGKDVVRKTIEKIWRVNMSMDFTEIGNNVFVVTFANRGDRNRVLAGCLWLFDSYLFALKPFDGSMQGHLLDFSKANFWIQMYNLQLGGMNCKMGEAISSSIGKVLEVDGEENEVAWGRFIRVKVECELIKPLAWGRTVNYERKQIWIPFRYEKLPKICFRCGCILHSKQGCLGGEGEGSKAEGDLRQFGAWMRASTASCYSAGRQSKASGMGSNFASTDRGKRERRRQMEVF
ncbi:uncharacterized protein LOC121267271 [Juglans microcarpa x Juglans regia]|uniref:uncharacterized protein LOC121267271 n=1 Tax=Juglans microcarpa x Juglans regia TaxID=2249226 RepID=UPI001B7F4419|nr:uncharacterized protein LOC121267271 [Juglans microcarpa x Juglans regia]